MADCTPLCVVLAGGQGQRMGGADKGLQPYQGRPLIAHVMERLRQQQGVPPMSIAINANRHLDQYAAWGYPVWSDGQEGYGGPLQGMLASLRAAPPAATLLFVACDTPHLPLDLVQRLQTALKGKRAAAVRVQDRMHPLPCMLQRGVEGSLEAYLAQGQRKLQTWLESCGVQWLDFENPAAFENFNTLADLEAGGA